MDRLSDLMPRVLSKKGLTDQATAALITHLATQWIADHLKEHASSIFVVSFKHRNLEIEVTHGISAQEFMPKKQDLQEYLNEQQPGAISDIVVRRSRNKAN